MSYFFETYNNLLIALKEYAYIPVDFQKSADVGERMKNPATVEEFISILSAEDRSYRLSFSKKEEEIAFEFFHYNNYYNFSIFPKLLPQNGKVCSFSDALVLHKIDEYMRKEIHYFTTRIEKWIKISLAYQLSHFYESEEYAKAECYLDSQLYNSRRTYQETSLSIKAKNLL